jgi:D-3-phosphoglycerate dehydrogenase
MCPAWPGSRDYHGDPDEMVGFVDKAEVLVTQFAPVLGQMLDRMPLLKLIAVSRGGPVNIDMAALQRGVRVCNASGRNASAGC